MSDVFSPPKRQEIMRHVKSKNTAPEVKLRSLLHKNGFRFRLNRKDLPGKPDIVLPKFKAVIFVHGCFGMDILVIEGIDRKQTLTSGTKIESNIARDKKILRYWKRKVGEFWSCGNARLRRKMRIYY